mgnify:CR=1 FL=1
MQALQCMYSWIQFGVNIEEVDHLLLSVFSCLDNEELFDPAIDALIEVITHPTVYRWVQSVPSYVIVIRIRLSINCTILLYVE